MSAMSHCFSVPPARPLFNALKSYESPYFSSSLTVCATTSGRGELRLDRDLILPLCSCDSHLPLPVFKYNQHLSFCCQAEHFNKEVYQDRLTFVASLMWTLAELQLFVFILFFKATRSAKEKRRSCHKYKAPVPICLKSQRWQLPLLWWKLYSLYSENTKSVPCGSVFPVLQFFSLWQGESSSEMYVYLQSTKSSLHPACTLIGTAYQ